MVPSRDEIETRIESLAHDIAELRSRVRALESGRPRPARPAGEAPPTAAEIPPAAVGEWAPAEVVGLAGRTLVVLGGAFLIRAISAAALLPDLGGPLVGLAYAAWWLLQADRTAATNGRRTSAFFHGMTGLGIAYPLIAETSARFHLLPGIVAAPAIVVFLILALTVASRRSLRNLSWVATAGALFTSTILFLATREFILYAGAVLAVATCVESLGFRDRWPELRWGPALNLNLVLVVLAVLVAQPQPSAELAAELPPGGVTAVSLLTPLLYLASVATSTLVRQRAITVFEMLQVGASLLCGIATALTVIAFYGGDSTLISVAILLIGMTCYAVAFISIDADTHPPENFYAYTSFAGVLVAVGSYLLLDTTGLAMAWFALACVGIPLGIYHQRNTLRLHGSMYLAASAICSGLAATGLHGLLGALTDLRPSLPPPAALIAAGTLALYAALAAARDRAAPHWSEQIPRAIVAAVAVWVMTGLSAPWLTSLLPGAWSGPDQAASLVTMRTCVLSIVATTLAWAGYRWSLPELRWLVYPLMAGTAARMLWEDLRLGGPLHLFLAFGFYGAALIATSRMIRKDS